MFQFIRRPEITKAAQFAKPDRLDLQPSQRLDDPPPAGGGGGETPEVTTTGRFQPPTTLNYGFR